MKIIPKLTLALFAGTSVLLAVNGYLRVQRERAYYEADRVRDHELVGRSLAAAAVAAWRADGAAAALAAVDAVNHRFPGLRIRFVPSADLGTLPAPVPSVAPAAGEPITRVARGAAGEPVWDTIVPLEVAGERPGVLEISEPMTGEARFVRNVIGETAALALTLALVSATLSFVMGQWLVGKRVRQLSDKTRRIGRGDFAGPLALDQHDELTDLARDVNAMCDRLATTLQQLRHADRLATVGKLASGIAHELGTPLNVVAARAQMIVDGDTQLEESREYARVVVSSTERMTRIIRQLLQFARRSGLEKSPRDVVTLTRDALDLLRPLARKAGIEVTLEVTGDVLVAPVDGAQLQQVVTNLVMNAVQASRPGAAVRVGVTRERVVAPESEGGTAFEAACVTVADQGSGIAPEHLEHVFEPFFTTKDVGEGTGLGLAVAYGIVRDHGGLLVVESQIGRGATFRAAFPVDGTNVR